MVDYKEWHYSVHVRFGEVLHYYFLPFSHIYNRREVFKALTEFMDEEQIEEYSYHEVLGTFDVILRAWLPATRALRIKQDLTDHFTEYGLNPGNIELFQVETVPYHWLWPEQGVVRRTRSSTAQHAEAQTQLNSLTMARLANVHRGEDPKLEESLKSADLLKNVTERKGIRFFVTVSQPAHMMAATQAADLRTDIVNALRGHATQPQLVLYEGFGDHSKYLIEGLVKTSDYSRIADIIDNINQSGIHRLGVKTTTFIALRPDPAAGKAKHGGFIKEIPMDEPRVDYDAEYYLNAGESANFEYKGSLEYDFGKFLSTGVQEKNDALSTTVMKTIVAFLNTQGGGSLLIGVVEDRKLKQFADKLEQHPLVGDLRVVGINWEYKNQTWDEYSLKLNRMCQQKIGQEYAGYITAKRLTHDGRDLCLVEVAHLPQGEWAYLDGKQFFVRHGASTIMLEGAAMATYQKLRQPPAPKR